MHFKNTYMIVINSGTKIKYFTPKRILFNIRTDLGLGRDSLCQELIDLILFPRINTCTRIMKLVIQNT